MVFMILVRRYDALVPYNYRTFIQCSIPGCRLRSSSPGIVYALLVDKPEAAISLLRPSKNKKW